VETYYHKLVEVLTGHGLPPSRMTYRRHDNAFCYDRGELFPTPIFHMTGVLEADVKCCLTHIKPEEYMNQFSMDEFLDALAHRGILKNQISMHRDTGAFQYKEVTVAPLLFITKMAEEESLQAAVDYFMSQIPDPVSAELSDLAAKIDQEKKMAASWQTPIPPEAQPLDPADFQMPIAPVIPSPKPPVVAQTQKAVVPATEVIKDLSPPPLEQKPTLELVFFDFETNGIKKSSCVLAVTALKVVLQDGKFIFAGDFERFYLPRTRINTAAAKVNGLFRDVLIEKRKGHEDGWFAHFDEDTDFVAFAETADRFIAHNIKFDYQFLPFEVGDGEQFCTMLSNTDIVKITASGTRHKGYKWPKLQEAAEYYKIPTARHNLHDAKYDTYLCFMIFKKMFEAKNPDVEAFLWW